MEQDLDEDAGAGGCVFLGEADGSERGPGDRVGVEQVPEELGGVAQLVDFESVHGLVLPVEEVQEEGRVLLWKQDAQTLGQQPKEPEIGPLLSAALEDHVAELRLLALSNVKLEEFVAALFEVNRGHDD